MAKEDYLLSKCGRENPFKVPEGYFDQFTDDLMAKLPERTFDEEAPRKVTLWDKVKRPRLTKRRPMMQPSTTATT